MWVFIRFQNWLWERQLRKAGSSRGSLSSQRFSTVLNITRTLKSSRWCRLHPSVFTVLENKAHNLKISLIILLQVNRYDIFLVKILFFFFWQISSLAAGLLFLFSHSTCGGMSLWLKFTKHMHLSLFPSASFATGTIRGLWPALSLLSFQLPFAGKLSYFHYIIDEETEVLMDGFAQSHTACRWQSQNSNPGCYARLVARPRPPTPRRWGGGSNRCFNTLGTISSLFILSSLEHFLSPGPPAAPPAAKTLECQL